MTPCVCKRLGNLGSDKRSSSRGIDLVVPVLRSNDDAIVADVVTLMADDENLGGSNAAEALIAVGITKSNN